MITAGFARVDITPRVGVQLCGFGPYINRVSSSIHDKLRARAMALACDDTTIIVMSCDLVGISHSLTGRIRSEIESVTGIPGDNVMICCTHTHSGPNVSELKGWGEKDPPYMETLPCRLAECCRAALADMKPVRIGHARVPCEGMGYNREHEQKPDYDSAIKDTWRPEHPEITDTFCDVLTLTSEAGLSGFLAYFGCHPVVCCAETTLIHGDYCGVALNRIEEDMHCSGLFLQGANGDVNTCVVHEPEERAMPALDILSHRFERCVRSALSESQDIHASDLACARTLVRFTRKTVSREELQSMLRTREQAIRETALKQPCPDQSADLRMNMVYVESLRDMLRDYDEGTLDDPETEVQGIRLGSAVILASGFETFQAIKNEVTHQSPHPITMVVSTTNDLCGYAPDHEKAAKGGYAASQVPFMLGHLPYQNIHDELRDSFLSLADKLQP